MYFPAVDLHCIYADDAIAGFIGISGDSIEMLFVDDIYRGQGFGAQLIAFAKANGATKVDVNEKNPQALAFYLSKGFHIESRDATDADGRPFPILHLSL